MSNAPVIRTGLSDGASAGTVVESDSYSVLGHTGGESTNGIMLEPTEIFERTIESSYSDIGAEGNEQIKQDAQAISDFLHSGGDGNGVGGTPLTVSGSIQTDPKRALANALISSTIASSGKLNRESSVALATAISTLSGLAGELNSLISKDPNKHVGRTGIDEDTGWNYQILNAIKE